MEPVTISILGIILWENLGQPILDKAKDQYSEKALGKIDDILQKLPFKTKENEVIEAEIVEAIEANKIIDEKSMISFLEQSNTFKSALLELKKGQTGTEIINSFKDISNSKINIKGSEKVLSDSFENIKDSEINI